MKNLKEKLKHFFVPHQGNDFKAKVFHDTSLTILFAIVLVTFISGVAHKIALNNTNYLANVYSGILVDLTNADRTENALNQLTVSPILENAAELKAEDMAAKGYFAHYGPDGSTPWDWMKKAGYVYADAGENLAIDFTDSDDVDKAWMNSPTHRANILNSKFTEIGIATVKGTYQGRNTIYVVQMFGRPLSSKSAALSANISTVPVSQIAQVTSQASVPSVKGIETSPVSTPKPTVATTKPTTKPKPTSTVITKPIVIDNASSSFVTATTESTFLSTENTSTVPVAGTANNSLDNSDTFFKHFVKEISTNPNQTLEIVYGLVGFIITIGLFGMIKKDLEVNHLKHALGGVLLLVIMFSLAFVYHQFGSTGNTIIAANYLNI